MEAFFCVIIYYVDFEIRIFFTHMKIELDEW